MPDPETVRDTFTAFIEPGGVVWDVGAYDGRYTDLALRAEAGRVFAFEPDDGRFQTLTQRYAADDRVEVMPYALYSERCWGRMVENDGGPSTARFAVDEDGITPATTIDRLTRVETLGLPRPDVLKVDVEGAEVDVLKGGRQTLTESQAALVEVHAEPVATTSTRHYGYEPHEVEKELANAGLGVEVIGGSTATPTYHVLGVR